MKTLNHLALKTCLQNSSKLRLSTFESNPTYDEKLKVGFGYMKNCDGRIIQIRPYSLLRQQHEIPLNDHEIAVLLKMIKNENFAPNCKCFKKQKLARYSVE